MLTLRTTALTALIALAVATVSPSPDSDLRIHAHHGHDTQDVGRLAVRLPSSLPGHGEKIVCDVVVRRGTERQTSTALADGGKTVEFVLPAGSEVRSISLSPGDASPSIVKIVGRTIEVGTRIEEVIPDPVTSGLHGVVRDPSGQLASGAGISVRLTRHEYEEGVFLAPRVVRTKSDVQGRFQISGLWGSCLLSAETTRSCSVFAARVDVARVDSDFAVELVTAPAGRIEVVCRYGADDDPNAEVNDATPTIETALVQLGISAPQSASSAVSYENAWAGRLVPLRKVGDNRWRSRLVPDGEWKIHAYGSGIKPIEASARPGAAPCEITLDRGLYLHGSVTAADDGAPVAGARVSTEYVLTEEDSLTSTRTNRAGVFAMSFGHERPRCGIVVDAPGYIPTLLPDAGVELDSLPIRVALEAAGAGVRGRVICDDGSAASGVVVEVCDVPFFGSANRAFALRGKLRNLDLGWRTTTDDDGCFELRGVPGDECVVRLFGTNPARVLSQPVGLATISLGQADRTQIVLGDYGRAPVLAIEVVDSETGNQLTEFEISLLISGPHEAVAFTEDYAIRSEEGLAMIPIPWIGATVVDLRIHADWYESGRPLGESGIPVWEGEMRVIASLKRR